MPFDTVIRNGTVVTVLGTYVSDIGISGGRIAAIAQTLPIENLGKVLSKTAGLLEGRERRIHSTRERHE